MSVKIGAEETASVRRQTATSPLSNISSKNQSQIINIAESTWARQTSTALDRFDKKACEDLLAIASNFVPKKGVTYLSNGAVTAQGEPYKRTNENSPKLNPKNRVGTAVGNRLY